MRTFFETVVAHAGRDPARIACSDSERMLTRSNLLSEAARLAARLPKAARTVGLLMPNSCDQAIAQLACVAAGRITVPLPTFFSPQQLEHIVRDAGIDLVLTGATDTDALPAGLPRMQATSNGAAAAIPAFEPGFGAIIYTSGSTGQPKGVRHESGQIGWSAAALARAIDATESDSYLSLLPLSLLLETICAIFVPALVGGRVHFDTAVAEAIGRGAPSGIAESFAQHRPTTGVLVPELLRLWVAELAALRRRAPDSLRFVAVGGAAVPVAVAEAAWQFGIPVHEGYGLSECCSVVALNRPGQRVGGTVGQPLPGLSVAIHDGEVHVDGPCVTDGYLSGGPSPRPWPTGDLGALDDQGRLTIFGRRDNLIVTALGRNISPEWVETTLLQDPSIAFCAVAAAEAGLAALIVATPQAAGWFASAGTDVVQARIAGLCAALPAYARPLRVEVISLADAKDAGLLTDNGRIRRRVARDLLATLSTPSPLSSEERTEP
ncbi:MULTISPECIES: AMP-binding protein [unclassified Bradyrhizobium]|uniref:AMP-binding protein n=1 Tax=unclassified Bradyrhizobium TaxID=2631580 RepID=UPI0028E1B5D0|nr:MULTISPECIES: AMP-binding protein [unclassified Bradyrhizobium]